MMFPIAESVGDLIYQETSSVRNLTQVLANQFEAVRLGYNDKAATLAILYRHSLTHQDEMQGLLIWYVERLPFDDLLLFSG
jgi:hypothetical protein